jgi:hypothetical protein
MKNFIAYLKLNLRMISGDLVLIGLGGMVLWALASTFIGFLFLPLLLFGIAWISYRPVKKIFEDSLFGDGASLHMSLPLDCRTVILVKLVACELVIVVMLAAILLPLQLAGIDIWSGALELVKQAGEIHYSGALLLAVVVADVLLFLFMSTPIDLMESIRFHCQPLNSRSRLNRFLSRLPLNLPFVAFILWNATRDDSKTPILDWLAGSHALPVLLAVGVIEILIGLLAIRGSIRLMETRYYR